MAISLKPSDAADPIADGGAKIVRHIASRTPVSIETLSVAELEHSDSLLITARGETAYKADYLLHRVDPEKTKRDRKEHKERIKAEVDDQVAAIRQEVEGAANARVAEAIAAYAPYTRVLPADLRARDLESYCFNTDATVEADEKIYEGFLSRGDLTVWVGREKHRKSNIMLMLAICLPLGLPFLGFRFLAEAPMQVVIIDYESRTGSLKRRYDSIVAAMKLTAEQRESLKLNLKIIEVRRIRKHGVSFPKFPHKSDPDALYFWEQLVAANPADFYFFDPLRSVHGSDENDSNIESMLTEMQRICRGKSIVAAHHMRKPGDKNKRLVDDMREWSEGARGSSAIKASVVSPK